MRTLVTGAAGFIGFHLARRLVGNGHDVVGLDNLNDYYDVALKTARRDRLTALAGFRFVQADLVDKDAIGALFAEGGFDRVINLAAQPGVRYSLVNPDAYVASNVTGFVNLLEACRHHGTAHLVYASSSSVYGANASVPFSVHDRTNHPVSLYGATKKSNELLAHAYSHLFGIPTTGLRFFTVYGPWGRPDMAVYLFTRAIVEGRPITVYNHGDMSRDFTFVDDIVDGLVGAIGTVPQPDPGWDAADPDPATGRPPYRVYNLGNHRPENLLALIETIEDCVGRKAEKVFADMLPEDVRATYADIEASRRDLGFEPKTPLADGIESFVRWYRDYHGPW